MNVKHAAVNPRATTCPDLGFQLPIRGRRAHGSHERARSARKGRKKHVSVLPRPNRSPWIVVEQNHNGIGKLMVPAFQIYANMNVINDL